MPPCPSARRSVVVAAIALTIPACPRSPSRDDRGRESDHPQPPPPAAAPEAGGRPARPICPAPEQPAADAAAPERPSTRFAVIGDYGIDSDGERAVAALVKSWNPQFIITTGDNNYPLGAAETIDVNIGKYFHEFIGGYHGLYGCAAATNRFFPAIGNHDTYTAHGQPYRDYFQLPGNERYYDFVKGPVHLFALDSDASEPDGRTASSAQAAWLRGRLAASSTRWQVVYMHHPPYSSGPHGSTADMQWPYAAWGADLVLAGHDHTYERVEAHGITYLVNGLGGAEKYPLRARVKGSIVSYADGFGALLIDADGTSLRARFYGTAGDLVDELRLGGS